MSDIESGREMPSLPILEQIIQKYQLSPQDAEQMYRLAADSEPCVATQADLLPRLSTTEYTKSAMRVAKGIFPVDEEWEAFVEKMKVRSDTSQQHGNRYELNTTHLTNAIFVIDSREPAAGR